MDVVERVLVSKEQLDKQVEELGARISKDYQGQELVIIGVLKGGFIFLADLARKITIPVDLDFMSVSSYGNSSKSSGVVKIIKDVDTNITGKHVLIVEDIIDTGLTLNHLVELLKTRGPLSVKVCAALDKPSRRKVDLKVDYKGIEIPDEFVIGYGLDYAGKYRNIAEVCVLKREVYTKK
ncbi:hypoxanthine phosphoribosyltransferase [Ruminiclostridium papyrosolvens DSM 2782]|uniref:Hypoxanthine phosphoribosyltransferase n=1 Tax=Ruminiclostridium papyrosolvens DSM 2782 TaxID=588581 RepID=F1TCN5_9FIRM|nr:hypoxanthine phosphoribosyltransferase [Ruminiclostridium papyrosolvens]EGD47752.1 hypoxanthine phosphoribosyltransferase [Ruminiclostridium papyrosolvens DSM 2782]WES34469.1 hypoxanthine phosphoribosyltransferase [Ruminiclostridium papyrosolvens DSM 2782]